MNALREPVAERRSGKGSGAHPRLPRMRHSRDESFFVATELLDASSDARRAAILLRLPDAIVLERSDALMSACRQARFSMGLLFLVQRIAALSANRGPDGKLPAHITRTLDIWYKGMSAMATQGDLR